MSSKTAAIVIIGNEILSGRTQDRNINFIAKRLSHLGIVLKEARVIADIEEQIITTVKQYSQQYDYVFTTGGIGPTHDDITTASIAKLFEAPIHRHPDAVNAISQYYQESTVTETRLKMADVPKTAKLLTNPISGAPGYQIGNVLVLPGVPDILQAMFDNIATQLDHGQPILSINLETHLPESRLAAGMSTIQQQHPSISIGSYPFFREAKIGVSVILRGTDKTLLIQQRDKIISLIKANSGEIINQDIDPK